MIAILIMSVALFGGIVLPLVSIGKWLKTREFALIEADQ